MAFVSQGKQGMYSLLRYIVDANDGNRPDKRLLNAIHARLYDCKVTFVYRLSTRLDFTGRVWIGYDQCSDTAECVRLEWTSMLCGKFLDRMKPREELKQHPVGWAIE